MIGVLNSLVSDFLERFLKKKSESNLEKYDVF